VPPNGRQASPEVPQAAVELVPFDANFGRVELTNEALTLHNNRATAMTAGAAEAKAQ